MLTFFALLILWFLFFIYNKFNIVALKDYLLFFYKINLNNLERANIILILLDFLLVLTFVIFLIVKIVDCKKSTQKIIKKPVAKKKTVRKVKKTATTNKKKEATKNK